MKLEGEYLFDATVPEVWSALFDPVILAAVMPGCEKLELVDGHYVGEIKVKVGPIQGKFTGKVDLKDKVEPESYTMVVDGRGAPGFVKATAQVKLAREGDGTRVFYDTDAQVGGKIASVGQRLLEASARAIVAQSLEGLHTNIKLRAAHFREIAATAAAAPAPASAPSEPALASIIVDDAAADPAASGALTWEEPTAKSPAAEAAAEAAASESADIPPADASVRWEEPTVRSPASSVRWEEPTAKSPAALAKAAELEPAAGAGRADAAAEPAKPAEPAGKLAEAGAKPAEAGGKLAEAGAKPAEAAARPAAVAPAAAAFTPVKVKQSALANAVAKEVASTLFPRSVLVGIIVIQAVVIVWLLLRH
jgi:carbon monoxide dehydrogenase subunit G